MHAMCTFACCKASSDCLMGPSKFPFPYLGLLWSARWIDKNGEIPYFFNRLCNLMFQAITDPTSHYRPEHAILSVEQFVASSGVIGEGELRVFFEGLAYCRSSIADDPASLLFWASLTLKLCQQSYVSMPKIFSLLIQARLGLADEVHLLVILSLLRSLSSKTPLLGDNTAVHAETDFTDELSPELDTFNETFCYYDRYYYGDIANYGLVSILSLLPALNHPHQVVNQIVRLSPQAIHRWRSAFRYCDQHGQSAAYLCPLMMTTSEFSADSPIRQRQAHLIPQLSKQLNELDSTFELPEGPYTFEYELRAKDMIDAA
jgi:hypothetical protein